MKRWLTSTAVWLACLGIVLPRSVFAAPGADQTRPLPSATTSMPVVTDVALGEGGTLVGQVVDQQGQAVANTPVIIHQQEQEVASTATDANGQFRVSGLHGGVYQVSAAQGTAVYRLWAPQTAPPAAQASAMLVSNPGIVRGQNGGGLVYWLTNPWVLAGLLAAAITIPIALNNDHKGSS